MIEEENCSRTCLDDQNVTPLHLSARNGYLNVVEYLTRSENSDTLQKCSTGSTPLNQAALHGELAIVQFFISELGYDKDTRGQWKRSLLHDAAQQGHMHIVKYLVEDLKFDPACLGDDKVTPIHLAAKYGHLDIVKYLILQYPCNLEDSLLEAASYGDVEYISLSGYNGDPNTEDRDRRIPLCYAAEMGHLAVVKYLHDIVQVHAKHLNDSNTVSLNLAAKHGNLDTVKFFTEKSFTYSSRFYCPPLHLAALGGHCVVIKHFVLDLKCNADDQCFRNAVEEGHFSVVKFLINEGKYNPLKEFPDYQVTPLHVATYYGHMDLVAYLINEVHCDPLKVTSWGSNSLNIAAANGHLQIVKFFSEL
ncbi:MAG: ankyrin repeat domain-containing protein, partial [Proteobacteria bacterium]|nr:ankyrin repeat domain-containing protein [Pseudomonadota bacterium]